MYNTRYRPEIYSVRSNEIEESENSSFQARQSHSGTNSISSIGITQEDSYRPPLVKQFYSGKLKTWLPWSLHPDVVRSRADSEDPEVCQVEQSPPAPEVDIRPHIFDPVLQKHLLVDSGSQVSAFPPDPGDKPDPRLSLKAANGSKIKAFGFKELSVKIGRKPYKFKIIKAEVEYPIIGWDFMKHHKLDLRWNDREEITIYDKKSKTSSVLQFKPIPIEKSLQLKNLSLISADCHLDQCAENPEILLGEVAAVKALSEDEASSEDNS